MQQHDKILHLRSETETQAYLNVNFTLFVPFVTVLSQQNIDLETWILCHGHVSLAKTAVHRRGNIMHFMFRAQSPNPPGWDPRLDGKSSEDQ
jgi:hypothetical protein